MPFYPFLCLAVLIGLTGCARPVADMPGAGHGAVEAEIRHEMGEALEAYVAAERRLYLAAMPQYMANAALCPRRFLSPGFVVHSDFDVPKGMQYVAYERMLLGREARVTAVAVQSGAWDLGVRTGDILVSIEGKQVRNAAQARARLKRIQKPEAVHMGFARAGHTFEVAVPFEPACHYPLTYIENDRSINAYATGSRIAVTKGMMDFVSDDELAVVVGHELAHNIMHHVPKGRDNTVIIRVAGALIDGITGVAGLSRPMEQMAQWWEDFFWSPQFEKEADYIGLYLLARAGGNIEAASPFWRRVAVEHGQTGITHGRDSVSTHPVSAARFVILANTAKEIREKKASGAPLMPNMRKPWNFGEKYRWWEADLDDEREWESGNFGN